ncbi:hypothetical protein [Streptomyces sp. B1I3]|nr:hypothetical protein [Streptomyces sp. B1I3]MDQ0792656.1 hypothetical protein [Streptomyces sp. B1I3]
MSQETDGAATTPWREWLAGPGADAAGPIDHALRGYLPYPAPVVGRKE